MRREKVENEAQRAESVREEDSAKENERARKETKKILCHKAMEKEVLRRKDWTNNLKYIRKDK